MHAVYILLWTVSKPTEFSLPSAAVVRKQLFWAILVLRAVSCKIVINSNLNISLLVLSMELLGSFGKKKRH